jgi:hypothetical protein
VRLGVAGIVAVILAVSLCGGGETESDPNGVVSAVAAEFVLPIPAPDGEWAWCHTTTPDNVLEYRWMIRVGGADSEYEFGFSLFKFPGCREAHGSLDDLLAAGQANVWKLHADGGASVVDGAQVSMAAGNGAVFISITDPAIVTLLFGNRPPKARAVSKEPGAPESVKEMSLRYR